MNIEIFPYILLLFAVIAAWLLETRVSVAILGSAVVAGLVTGKLTPLALIWIGMLGVSIWLPTKVNLRPLGRALCFGVFLILAIAMSNHVVPGFNNLTIFRGSQFSPDSIPFTMYLNFDKTIVGLFIYLFFLKSEQLGNFKKEHLIISGKVLASLLAVIVPTAFVIRYVRFDIKFPEFSWIWILNNLFFVCLAEEALFRGFIQKGLSNIFPRTKLWSIASLVLASVLFGLAHYKGGLSYIVLATLAGIFYGYAYLRTNRLEASILVHFCLNLFHFLLLSYPALIR